MWTSTDGQKFAQTDTDDVIVAGTATKLVFANDATNGYSDDATILYAYTDALIIRSVDTYGNLSDVGTTEPTVALSVVTGAGAFYTDQTGAAYTNAALSAGCLSSNAIYYRPTSAGTHTLTGSDSGQPQPYLGYLDGICCPGGGAQRCQRSDDRHLWTYLYFYH